METEQSCVETPATLRALKELLPKSTHDGEDAPERRDESNYVDLEFMGVKTSMAKAGKGCCFGARNPMPVLMDNTGAGALCAMGANVESANETDVETKKKDCSGVGKRTGATEEGAPDSSTSSVPLCIEAKSGGHPKPGDKSERVITQPEVSRNEDISTTPSDEELHCGDHHLSGRSHSDDYEEDEEDDDVSLVLSDDFAPWLESHYITTHEIQLSELSDHEGDYDLGSSTSWDIEDDNQVYSFVDYASLNGDGAMGDGGDGGQPRSQGAAATVSTLLESDLCHGAKITSLDESASKPLQQQQQQQHQQQCSGNSGGQIHLSIRTTSRAINDPGTIQEHGNIVYHARRPGDVSHYVFRGVDGKAGTVCDTAKCFIAAPRRVHFGGKLRGKEVTEYSSGASSAVSELDDADKEVRNLTAKAFKSLAYPYLDAINFSTSSESSASEHGLGINRWSTFVDLKYGNMNVSEGLDHSVVSHQNSTASFEIAKNIDNKGYKGVALASIKPPTSKIFTLSGNPHGSSSSTKQIELMGKFSQGHSGVITLTETLNFRCNVKSGMSGGERRTDFAQNAAGSPSTDKVTNSLPSGQRRGASKPPSKTMEDTHKKAIFASSVIKNVISKKMQFEQERRMERGEIREPRQAPSPCFAHQESDGHKGKGSRELRRQSSRFSESSSDYAITCLEELGDIVDSGSCDTKSDSRRQDAPETNLEPTSAVGSDIKKGALEASKSTLLRSQNSAFRCWKDEEVEFPKEYENDKTQEEKPPPAHDKEAEGDQCSAGGGKPTKMSHLFVPSIQLLSSDGEVGQQLQNRSYSQCGDGGGVDLRAEFNSSLRAADSRSVATSKSPEIKINLRSVRDSKAEPFGVSKLRTPNIGCNAASLARANDFTCQTLAASLKGESSDKVPQFTVRDIRDNKGKLQTPIHQVRDVRKLVKSSYHIVSLDNNENKLNGASADGHPEQNKQTPCQNPNSVSPIVIKCQSVNTNSHGKPCGDLDLSKREPLDGDRSSPEGAKSAPLQWAAGRAATNDSSEGGLGVRVESRLASKKQDKIPDVAEKKPESKMGNLVAFEKLQAAVKTMEQLYVFDKNEWKRKNELQPLTDSHVLSLLGSEQHGGPEDDGARESNVEKSVRKDSHPNMDKAPPAVAASPSGESLLRREDRDPLKGLQISSARDDRPFAKSTQTTGITGSKNMFSLSSTAAKVTQPNTSTQTPFSARHLVPKSPVLPVSCKISQQKVSGNERAESKEMDRTSQYNENYLTIPVKSHASSSKQPPSADKASAYTPTAHSNPTTPPGHLGFAAEGQRYHNQTPSCSRIGMEACSPGIHSATFYHSLPLSMSTNQPQVYCFSPAITPAPALDPFQATQRKMLLDPTTGNYYLVDTPVQPATKRLFDPETGQYVDVPLPQPPMTPVPMPISPFALSPGAYGHTYMIYPGFMPTPSVIPARTLVPSQMSVHSEVESGDKAASQQTEGIYMESPYYMATGKSPLAATGAQQQVSSGRAQQGFSSAKQPVISLTSQQGPRIIAPPSFDGTTMSFVVEHR